MVEQGATQRRAAPDTAATSGLESKSLVHMQKHLARSVGHRAVVSASQRQKKYRIDAMGDGVWFPVEPRLGEKEM